MAPFWGRIFKWIFTEPIKIEKFSEIISINKLIIWILKTYILMVIMFFIFILIANFFDISNIYSNFIVFKDTITIFCSKDIYTLDKFLFLLKIFGIKFILFSLLYGFAWNLLSGLISSFYIRFYIWYFI